eukprot:6920419-Pyramimonas_sp.AAC.1
MSQAVCSCSCLTALVFISNSEDVSSGALIPAPLRGAATDVFTGPFAASLWGCLGRFARSHAQHPLLSEQI